MFILSLLTREDGKYSKSIRGGMHHINERIRITFSLGRGYQVVSCQGKPHYIILPNNALIKMKLYNLLHFYLVSENLSDQFRLPPEINLDSLMLAYMLEKRVC